MTKDLIPDAKERARIESDLDTTLLVEAGAGSGKTTSLVNRMAALINTGKASVDQIAAVTFTRKAAAELRERFQEKLEEELLASGDIDITGRIREALSGFGEAPRGTIHAF